MLEDKTRGGEVKGLRPECWRDDHDNTDIAWNTAGVNW